MLRGLSKSSPEISDIAVLADADGVDSWMRIVLDKVDS